MSEIQDLNKPGVYATYEADDRIIYVTYSGILTGEATRHYYQWLTQQLSGIISEVRGSVFDFRAVEEITSANTRTITQSSHGVHRNIDLRHIGVALIARDHYQEHLLRITADMTPNPHTKRVVHSMGDALEYIREWSDTLNAHDQLA
ncbi:MAG: hypothetical protein AAFU54_11005 [Chloroflexota bacterium]